MKPTMLRLVAAVVVATSLTVAASGGMAHAQTGGGELGSDYVRATASDLGSGTFPGPGVPARQPSTASLFAWARSPSSLVCVFFTAPVPPELVSQIRSIPGPTVITNEVVGPGTPVDVPPGIVSVDRSVTIPGMIVIGDLVYDIGTQPTMVIVVPRCLWPGTPLLGEPPSPAEIWQQTPLPRTHVHASPPGTAGWPGITRLTSWFWGDRVAETSARVSLRGFDVTVVAHPIAYAWWFADGTTAIGADPGSRATPVRATFVRRGDYEVRLYVVWEGRAHVTFAGLDVADQDLGTVTLPERAPYHVAEVRALLRTTPGRP
jgi:hypothetical protein